MDDKKNIYTLIVTFILGCAFCWLLLNVSGNGTGTDKIRTDIQSVIRQQSEINKKLGTIEAGLERGAETAGRISTGLGTVATGLGKTEERIANSEAELKSDSEYLAEGKRILGAIRKRNEGKNQ